MRKHVILAFSLAAAISAATGAAKPAKVGAAGPAGSSAYSAKCAACHGAKLEGGFGPPLSGSGFKAKWSAKGLASLANYIKANMPPSDAGSLSAAQANQLAAMIGTKNGIIPKAAVKAVGSSPVPSPVSNSKKAIQAKADESAEGGIGSAILNEDGFYRGRIKQRKDILSAISPVTDASLQAPPAEDWLGSRRTLDGLASSPLKQINRDNVGNLTLAWSLALPSGTNGITPLVHDGVMFINSDGTVKALSVADGDELWSFSRSAENVPLGPPVSQPRSMAMYQDRLYVPTLDNHMIALDIHTGKVIWDHLIETPKITLRISAPPLIARGKIFQGMAGCAGAQETGGCFLVALDAQTGKELWRFYTLPRKGDPGFDTWGGAPASERFGGSIWSAPTYDSETGLIYFGVGQTYHVAPLLKKSKTDESNRALYTNATLALDPDTGKRIWFYQHMERDVWDFDWAFERYAFTMKAADGPRRVVGTVGKLGILDVLDAKTGAYVASFDMGMQDLVTAIDPKTGQKTTNPAAEPQDGVFKHICPFAGGVRNWPATSFDGSQGVLYVPFTRSCMNYAFHGDRTLDISYAMAPPVQGNGMLGGVMAIDMQSLKPLWVQEQRAAASSGVLATDGGVVFAGDRDRWFRALDSSNGKVLWQTRLDRRLSSNPITFAHGNNQYVAIVSGGGAPNDATQESLNPEISKTAPGVTLWVFRSN